MQALKSKRRIFRENETSSAQYDSVASDSPEALCRTSGSNNHHAKSSQKYKTKSSKMRYPSATTEHPPSSQLTNAISYIDSTSGNKFNLRKTTFASESASIMETEDRAKFDSSMLSLNLPSDDVTFSLISASTMTDENTVSTDTNLQQRRQVIAETYADDPFESYSADAITHSSRTLSVRPLDTRSREMQSSSNARSGSKVFDSTDQDIQASQHYIKKLIRNLFEGSDVHESKSLPLGSDINHLPNTLTPFKKSLSVSIKNEQNLERIYSPALMTTSNQSCNKKSKSINVSKTFQEGYSTGIEQSSITSSSTSDEKRKARYNKAFQVSPSTIESGTTFSSRSKKSEGNEFSHDAMFTGIAQSPIKFYSEEGDGQSKEMGVITGMSEDLDSYVTGTKTDDRESISNITYRLQNMNMALLFLHLHLPTATAEMICLKNQLSKFWEAVIKARVDNKIETIAVSLSELACVLQENRRSPFEPKTKPAALYSSKRVKIPKKHRWMRKYVPKAYQENLGCILKQFLKLDKPDCASCFQIGRKKQRLDLSCFRRRRNAYDDIIQRYKHALLPDKTSTKKFEIKNLKLPPMATYF